MSEEESCGASSRRLNCSKVAQRLRALRSKQHPTRPPDANLVDMAQRIFLEIAACMILDTLAWQDETDCTPSKNLPSRVC